MNNMKKIALLKNNIIVEIREVEDDDIRSLSNQCDLIIDITEHNSMPAVGWILIGNLLTASVPLDVHEKERSKMEARFIHGNRLADEMVKRMSIRNVELIKLGQVLNINAVIQTFSGIENALRKCALPTALSAINTIIPVYTEYNNEFLYAKLDLENFLANEAIVFA
jgi:hypothetical protein